MVFKKVDKVVVKRKKSKDKSIHSELLDFCKKPHKVGSIFMVDDNWYNNNNDLRHSISDCIKRYDLPLDVFMVSGVTYITIK